LPGIQKAQRILIKSASTAILASVLTLAVTSPAWTQQGSSANLQGGNSADISALESSAQRAMKRGDYQAAIQKYSELVKSSPRSADFYFQLGSAYYQAGHPRQAISPLREAVKLNPRLAHARYLLGASLAEIDHCHEALPYLKQADRHVTDPGLQRRIGMDGVKCSMELDRQTDAIDFLQRLRHRFPKNPQVLYLSVHVFSDLSTRASQALLTEAPDSYQVHELNAEALEAQGKWEQAEAEYKKVLEKKPDLPGIHFLIGRLILSKPKTATTFVDAKKQFEAELKVNPHNAGAEYILGELALHSEDYKTAITRFSKAAEYDPNFPSARIELGRALLSVHQPAKAIAPLEAAVRLQPQNPSAHYLLAMAYRGAGKMPEAQKELAAYRKATKNAEQNKQEIQSGILGRKSPAQLQSHPAPPRH